MAERIRYPGSRREDVVDIIHGVPVADPYRWLEGTGADVQAWMAAQDSLCRSWIAKLPQRDALRTRLKQLLYVETIAPPRRYGNRYFYTRRHNNKEKAVLYWRDAEFSEQVLLDPNNLTSDGSTSLGRWVPSPDGNMVAFCLTRNNSDDGSIHLIDVAKGTISTNDVILSVNYSRLSWTPDSLGFYYTLVPPPSDSSSGSQRFANAELRYHVIGTDPQADVVVFGPSRRSHTFLSGALSDDGNWLFAFVQSGWNSTEINFRNMRISGADWQKLPCRGNSHYEVIAYNDAFFVTTNEDAPSSRLFKIDPQHADRTEWHEIVPERRESIIQTTKILGGKLVLRLLRKPIGLLEVRELDGTVVREIPLPSHGTIDAIVGNESDDEAYFSFQSLTTPPRVYRTSISTGCTNLYCEVNVPVDASSLKTEHVSYASRDGARIPMVLVYPANLVRNGNTPFLLTGYGGFQVSMLSRFIPSLFPWLEAGCGYAVANLRGGGELGEEWHRAGMRENKQTTFDDFADAAQWLIDNGYTRPERLAARGASNGGLLMGAALTQFPELFQAVVCSVPLFDMIRYHSFGAGSVWTPEYGNADHPDEFDWLYAYSPYHRVAPGLYPSVLVLSADSDDRVDPMHSRKMVAMLQWAQQGSAPILLRIAKNAGHRGADLMNEAVEQSADAYAFLMALLGVSSPINVP